MILSGSSFLFFADNGSEKPDGSYVRVTGQNLLGAESFGRQIQFMDVRPGYTGRNRTAADERRGPPILARMAGRHTATGKPDSRLLFRLTGTVQTLGKIASIYSIFHRHLRHHHVSQRIVFLAAGRHPFSFYACAGFWWSLLPEPSTASDL